MASTIQVDNIKDIGGNTMISSNGSGTFTSNLPTVAPNVSTATGTLPIANGGTGAATLAAAGLQRPNVNPLIINGDMSVAQRATSVTGITSSSYPTCDRVDFTMAASSGTWTAIQETLTSGDAWEEGFPTAFRVDCTTAVAVPTTTGYVAMAYAFEGKDLQLLKWGSSNAEPLTMSFWVKSNKTGDYQVTFEDFIMDAKICAGVYTISVADTWEKKIINIPGSTVNSIFNTNSLGVRVHFYLAAGTAYTSGTVPTVWTGNNNPDRAAGQTVQLWDNTANDWAITGIQLEVGTYTSATIPSFQYESYGDSLSRCYRYYYKQRDPGYFGVGNIDGSNDAQILTFFPTTLRNNPGSLETNGTATDYLIRTTSNHTCTAVPTLSSSGVTQSMTIFKKTSHGITNGAAAFGRSDSSSAYLAWDVEL
tara:strand:- start:895 stop:2157 length:1263 start_codon:yes stop_codon:yes gene_type:complete